MYISIYCIPRTMCYSFIPVLCQIQAIWRSVYPLCSTNTLCSTILTYCTVQWQICTLSTLVYTHTGVQTLSVLHLEFIFRHDYTGLRHDGCTLRLYLKTIYILEEKHTVHIILTVHCTVHIFSFWLEQCCGARAGAGAVQMGGIFVTLGLNKTF